MAFADFETFKLGSYKRWQFDPHDTYENIFECCSRDPDSRRAYDVLAESVINIEKKRLGDLVTEEGRSGTVCVGM